MGSRSAYQRLRACDFGLVRGVPVHKYRSRRPPARDADQMARGQLRGGPTSLVDALGLIDIEAADETTAERRMHVV